MQTSQDLHIHSLLIHFIVVPFVDIDVLLVVSLIRCVVPRVDRRVVISIDLHAITCWLGGCPGERLRGQGEPLRRQSVSSPSPS